MTRPTCTAFVFLVAALADGSSAQSVAPKPMVAQAVPCAQGLFIGSGNVPSGRIQLCNEADRLVPGLAVTLTQIQRQLAAQDQQLLELQKLLRSANAASQRVGAKQIEMAQSLNTRLEALLAQPPAATLRSVRRLSDDFDQVVEQIERVERDDRKRDALGTVLAAIQDAVASIDLDRAGRLVASVEAIQARLDGVSRDVGAIKELGEESRNTAVFAEAQRTRARGDIGQTRVLGQLVAQGRTFDRHDLAGIAFSGLQASGLRAREADLSLAWFDGAALLRADLQGAQLLAANLDGAVFDGANLVGARAAFARARSASFTKANLSRGNWTGADLREAKLAGARLVGVSFMHADLRGADLRGADLSGAFLGNADLRGARLEGAVLHNTDVSYALLSRQSLTAQQVEGLCATPGSGERSQTWRVIERIPSGRFSGGYENSQLYEDWLYLGIGGHRPYVRCALRGKADLPDWNRPVWEHGNTEHWTESLALRVEHGLVDGSRRRRELLDRLEAVAAEAKSRPRELAHLPQFAVIQARLNRAMDERLLALTRGLLTPRALPMDRETAMLQMLRLRPEVLTHLGFDWRAASTAGFWGYADTNRDAGGWTWPRLYPDGFLSDDLSDASSKAFEAWSRARAKVIAGVPVEMDYQPQNARAAAPWSAILVYESHAGQPSPELSQRLGVPEPKVSVYPSGLPPTFGSERPVSIAFVVDGDSAALAAWAARQQESQRHRLPIQVQDVRWLPAEARSGNRTWLVWFVRVQVPS